MKMGPLGYIENLKDMPVLAENQSQFDCVVGKLRSELGPGQSPRLPRSVQTAE